MPEADIANSILLATKKKLGLAPDYTAFDPDIISYINSVFAQLHQLGIGPDECFQIEDDSSKWNEFYTDPRLSMVRSFMYGKVSLWFDPPTGSVLSARQDLVAEYEWRLTVAAETIRDENAE